MSNRGDFYRGETAQTYEESRSGSAIWKREDSVVHGLLSRVVSRGDLVVDVPVGTGRFVEVYRKIGVRLLGVDISDQMLAETSKKQPLNAQLTVANASSLPIHDASADAVVCIRFVHLVDRKTLLGALAEQRRVLKEGGSLVIGARVHPHHDTDGVTGRGGVLKRFIRTLRFASKRSDSRSRSERWFRNALRSAGFSMRVANQITVYDDGSFYAIYLAAAPALADKPANQVVELFGLPGVGKSSISRRLLEIDPLLASDGFRAIQKLGWLACLRRRPVAVAGLLARLLPVASQLREEPARRVVVTALRQLVASEVGDGTVLFEEGVCHEVWRQLMSGRVLSDRLISKVTSVADTVFLLEAANESLMDRLRSKSSPGPISKSLRDSDPQLGNEWAIARGSYDRIRGILKSNGTDTVVIDNAYGLDEGMRRVRDLIGISQPETDR